MSETKSKEEEAMSNPVGDQNADDLSQEESGAEEQAQAGDQAGADETGGEEKLSPIEAKVAELTEEKTFYAEKYTRLAAEFENFKKRNRQESETRLKYASSALVEGMLGSLDNLRRALGMAEANKDMADDEFVKGIRMVFDQFHATLENHGVKKIESLGKAFDPNCHESMGVVESTQYEDNHVAEVFREGYMHHDRVLRPAMVQIAKKVEG